MKLFDKLPENFFSPLSRKYRSVYAFSLITLYELLLTQKSQIKKVDYLNSLKNKGSDLMELFSITLDSQEATNSIFDLNNNGINDQLEDTSTLQSKTNYVLRQLQLCGWFEIDKDIKTNIEYIYLPIYSIQMLDFIYKITSDGSLYLPLVHQTYSELKLEEEKEDDQMFRTLLNAQRNSQELDLSVTTLKHSIKVFGNKLNEASSPNEALRQHFDVFKNEIGDKIYHPMKTYDSLGLYTQPIIQILHRWERDERVKNKLVSQAKQDVNFQKLSEEEIKNKIQIILRNLIDTFNALNREFFSIDKDNADYTEAVQKKVNFLSFSDKTMKGKIDAIISYLSNKIRKSSFDNIDQIEDIDEITETISINSQVFIDPFSLSMPYTRKTSDDSELMPLDDYQDFVSDDAIVEFMNREVSLYSDDAIKKFFMDNFKNKKVIYTDDFNLNNINDLVLYIYGVVKAAFGNYYFTIEKVEDQIKYAGYLMPKYKFTKGKEEK